MFRGLQPDRGEQQTELPGALRLRLLGGRCRSRARVCVCDTRPPCVRVYSLAHPLSAPAAHACGGARVFLHLLNAIVKTTTTRADAAPGCARAVHIHAHGGEHHLEHQHEGSLLASLPRASTVTRESPWQLILASGGWPGEPAAGGSAGSNQCAMAAVPRKQSVERHG